MAEYIYRCNWLDCLCRSHLLYQLEYNLPYFQNHLKRNATRSIWFTDEQKEQAVKMRAVGMSLSATVRVMGAGAPTVSEWVKKGGLATERPTRFLEWRTSGRQDSVRGRVSIQVVY